MNLPGTRKPRVIVVDPHLGSAELVSMLLDRDGDVSPVGESTAGDDALRLAGKFRPDLVITELELPRLNGSELIPALRERVPGIRVLIYTGSHHPAMVLAGMEAQPDGYALKEDSVCMLRDAIHACLDGGQFFTPNAMQRVNASRRDAKFENSLTPREREVLKLVAEGRSSKQIADQLTLGLKTVEHFRGALMRKLGARDVASLTLLAARHGMVEV